MTGNFSKIRNFLLAEVKGTNGYLKILSNAESPYGN